MNIDRMAKLLALASSPNDQEALAALRSVKRMLDADEMDFVDLADLFRESGRAEALERDLESARRQLRQAQLALRTPRAAGEATQATQELRRQIRKLTAENQTLKADLNARTEELEEWQAAHSALDTTLRQSSQERFQLRSKLRQKQMEMDQFLGEVRGMINLTSRLRTFMDTKAPAA
ncbi:MAG: hypothetical protein WCF85_06960 [Rhodospirillaceae bacterium]